MENGIILKIINEENNLMIDLKEVLTIPEAAEKYSVSEATLKFACAGRAAGGKSYPPRLTSEECRKSGKVWLLSRGAVERLFSKNKSLRQP